MHYSRTVRWVIPLLLVIAAGLAVFLLGYWPGYFRPVRTQGFPQGIVIHHTATPPVIHGKLVNVAFIDRLHADRGFHIINPATGIVYHIGYHFLVLQNGAILRGRPETLPGAHTHGHPLTLGIALVGNFQRSSNQGRCGPCVPPPAQMRAVEWLTRHLLAKYHLTPAQVYLHRDLCQTACPGDGFPRVSFFRAIRKR